MQLWAKVARISLECKQMHFIEKVKKILLPSSLIFGPFRVGHMN
jgi:hypothetical protein